MLAGIATTALFYLLGAEPKTDSLLSLAVPCLDM